MRPLFINPTTTAKTLNKKHQKNRFCIIIINLPPRIITLGGVG